MLLFLSDCIGDAGPLGQSPKLRTICYLCLVRIPACVGDAGPGGQRGDVEEAEHGLRDGAESSWVVGAEEEAAHDGKEVNDEDEQQDDPRDAPHALFFSRERERERGREKGRTKSTVLEK